MLGFKKRGVRQAEVIVAAAESRLQTAEADLAQAPWDRARREELRDAHNAFADLLTERESSPPAA